MNFQKWEMRLVVAITVAVLVAEVAILKAFAPSLLSSSGNSPIIPGLWFAGISFFLVIAAFGACLFVCYCADMERERIIQARLDRWVRPR